MNTFFQIAVEHPWVLLAAGVVVIFLVMHRATRVP